MKNKKITISFEEQDVEIYWGNDDETICFKVVEADDSNGIVLYLNQDEAKQLADELLKWAE